MAIKHRAKNCSGGKVINEGKKGTNDNKKNEQIKEEDDEDD